MFLCGKIEYEKMEYDLFKKYVVSMIDYPNTLVEDVTDDIVNQWAKAFGEELFQELYEKFTNCGFMSVEEVKRAFSIPYMLIRPYDHLHGIQYYTYKMTND